MTASHVHPDIDRYLQPGTFIDSDHPTILAFAERALRGIGASATERGVALYYAVRDGLRYDPYSLSLKPEEYVASTIAQRDYGFCIPKALLLVAAARAAGIPARPGYADVTNHLCTPKLRAAMNGQDLFIYHGYVEMYLNGQWIKSTPAFNKELCERFGVKTLEFNGVEHAMLHPFDRNGRQHMEYVRERSTFFDHPFAQISAELGAVYGDVDIMLARLNGDFAAEATGLL